MNLKKTIVSFMAAGAVIAGGFAGVAAQEATQDLSVTVSNDGVFSVEFCGVDGAGEFGALELDSETYSEADRTLTTETVICYTDDKADRGQYRAHLSAGDFTSEDGNIIDAENMKLGEISIMNSGQWGEDVGSIAAIDGAGNSIQRPNTPVEWGGGDFSEDSLHVHNIWPGAGTAGQMYLDDAYDYPQDDRSDLGSWQEIDLELIVPVDTVSDDYTSTLTITLNPAAPQ